LAVAASAAAGWDSSNAPSNFNSSYVYKLSKLPTHGTIPVPAWSETYWPSYQSGIAHRWNSEDPQDFKYHLFNKTELLQLQKDANFTVLKSLSPAEKFDIFKGRYDYPTVHEEWTRTHPTDAGWEGICHGWAPASLEYSQPSNVTLKNKDGIEVFFGASDIKGLLSFYAGQVDTQASVKFIGRRCNSDLDSQPSDANLPECLDLDAGAYHVIIANQLGLMHQGFVVDRERGYQVWNQPLNSFNSTVGKLAAPRHNATHGTKHSVMVHTDMTYSKETMPEWESHVAYQYTENYRYFLDLDSKGNIIGGDMMTYDRVDFAWIEKSSPFYGYWADLQFVYTNATNDTEHPSVVNMFTLSEDHMHAPTHLDDNNLSGDIKLGDFANLEHRSWAVGKLEDCEANFDKFGTVINFAHFESERYRDQLSIFEGPNGQGALVAVLHGSLPADKVVTVKGPCAFLVFKADTVNNQGGFEATWKVVPVADN
jgi:hypothetical protein